MRLLRRSLTPPRLDAVLRFIRPLQLHRPLPDLLGLPRADVPYFAMVVVIPASPGNGIGDGFAQFMGAGRSERIQCTESAEAPLTTSVGHRSVENLVSNLVVISAERLARAAPALGNGRARRRVYEI